MTERDQWTNGQEEQTGSASESAGMDQERNPVPEDKASGEPEGDSGHFAEILQEISRIPELTEEEEKRLEQKLPDREAKDRLIQGSLLQVIRIAMSMGAGEAELEDLVQEGNVALTLFLEDFRGGDFRKRRDEAVRAAMKEYLDGIRETQSGDSRYTDLINQVMDASAELAKQTGKTPTVQQIAERTGLTVDETERLMREAVNATTTQSIADRVTSMAQPDAVSDYLSRQSEGADGSGSGSRTGAASSGSWEENLAKKMN